MKPKDFEIILTLNQIKNWNMYSYIERIVKYKGFHSCIYEGKKTLIIK